MTPLVCALALIATPALGETPSPTARAQAVYSSSPQDVIVSLSRIPNTLEAPDQAPLVSVFGDGRVAVHLPRDRARSGSYQFRLGEFELARLVQSLVDKGLADFDVGAVLSRKRAIQAQREAAARRSGRPKVFYRTDHTVTLVSLNLIDYKPARHNGGWRGRVDKRIRWAGLDSDVRSFPTIGPIRGLADAATQLAGLSERSGLRRLP